MSNERWFPVNYELPDGLILRKLLSAGDNWQLYAIGHGSRALTCKPELSKRWIATGLMELSSFVEVTFGPDKFFLIESGSKQQLALITEFISPETKADAAAFAVSLEQTRKIHNDTSLHDAIYVERLSRLLPTWTVSEAVSDEQVLGCWLTGGVSVSTSSFRRMTSLLGWLDKSDIRDVIQLSGQETPNDIGVVRTKARNNDKTTPNIEQKEHVRQRFQDDTMDGSGLSAPQFMLSGRPFLEEFFNEHVVDIILNEERYKTLGVDFPSAVVLHGPPGCGKTFAVERLIEFLDWPAYHVDSNSVGSPYIHETSRKVSEIFEKAMEDAPAVIVIDEMESFLSDRQIHQSTGLHHVEEVAEFLRRIPEAMSNRVLVIGMTNRLEMIDPAILRRGRFDHVIEVGMPSEKEVTELVIALLGKMPVEGELSIETAISTLKGRPLSDAAFAVREAGRLAARSGKTDLDQKALDAAMAKLPDVPDEEKSNPIGFIWK
jgi:cell division protease FtsH